MMEEDEVAAIEYGLVRALKNFDTSENSESQALIRLALRQGRNLARTTDPGARLESLSKSADSLIDSTMKVAQAWLEVNQAVEKLQETYSNYSVKQVESISRARNRFENFLGRASGMTDILEGILQEVQDQGSAQKIIEKLNLVREHEKKLRQSGPGN